MSSTACIMVCIDYIKQAAMTQMMGGAGQPISGFGGSSAIGTGSGSTQGKRSRANSKKKRPPGPWAIPFVGSIHHMGTSQPPAVLRDLADKHGPVMYLRLGQIDTVIISSPAAAQEVLQANDLTFSSRPTFIVTNLVTYGDLDLGFAPYGDYWRAMRKICVIELLGARKVRHFAPIRDSETMSLVAEIRTASAAAGGNSVDIRGLLDLCTNSITSLAVFGDVCSQEAIDQFQSALAVMISDGSGFGVADLFPSLWFLDVLTGVRRRAWRAHRRFDEFFNKIIEECEAKWRERKVKDGEDGEDEAVEDNILSIMMRIRDEQELGFSFDNANIKAIIIDLFGAGTETISTAAEWVMSELIRHPGDMAKAQAEVREAFNNIMPHHHESHMDKLNYTKMVIKETLRLHPPVPLVPRLCRETCDISGFEVTKGCRVVINTWAIARNLEYWEDAEDFKPTRFENNIADYKGTEFYYLPFGSGRRVCPGVGFGLASLELIVARLLFYFNWSLPGKMLPEELNMETKLGMIAKRRNEQLHLVATPYDAPIHI